MSKQIFLLGGGGHGRVVLEALLLSGIKVNGMIDPLLKVGDQIFGISVIGDKQLLDVGNPKDIILINGIGANPRVDKRKKLFENFKARGFLFLSVKHPSVLIGLECVIGESSQIMAGTILQNRVRLGENVVINTGTCIDHDCIIESHSFISPGVVLCGNIKVGTSTFIGAGATILPGIEIGANVIIGAGAVIAKNISAGTVIISNPVVKVGIST